MNERIIFVFSAPALYVFFAVFFNQRSLASPLSTSCGTFDPKEFSIAPASLTLFVLLWLAFLSALFLFSLVSRCLVSVNRPLEDCSNRGNPESSLLPAHSCSCLLAPFSFLLFSRRRSLALSRLHPPLETWAEGIMDQLVVPACVQEQIALREFLQCPAHAVC